MSRLVTLSAGLLALSLFSLGAAAQSAAPTPPPDASSADDATELAKKLQNPIDDLYSVPFRNNVSVARPPHCLAQAEYDPLAGGCRTAGQPGLLRARCQLRGKLNVWRRIERRRYVVSWVSAAWGAFHFHGSSVSSSCRLVRPDTMRLSTSVSQANGSTSLSFAD